MIRGLRVVFNSFPGFVSGARGIVTDVTSIAQFESLAKKERLVTLVFYTAAWCRPCEEIELHVTDLAKRHKRLQVLRVDADEQKRIVSKNRVKAVPYFAIVRNGRVVERFMGADSAALAAKVTRQLRFPAQA